MFQSPRTGKFESNVTRVSARRLFLKMFQSPRTGKFESNQNTSTSRSLVDLNLCFNPLEQGNSNQIVCRSRLLLCVSIVSIPQNREIRIKYRRFSSRKKYWCHNMFQSPRTGKFESNVTVENMEMLGSRFNPLEQGNSNQILINGKYWCNAWACFNPLEQGNSNQIA